jgi:hypothetical protein
LISFNECLRRLVEEQQVELGDALAASDRPEELLLALRGIRGSSDRVQAPKNAPQTPNRAGPMPSSGDGLRLRQGRVNEALGMVGWTGRDGSRIVCRDAAFRRREPGQAVHASG